jgi:hypothetical protein
MRTVESVGATRATFARTARNAGDVPTISEFYRVAFRRKLYTTLEELQADLDAWPFA